METVDTTEKPDFNDKKMDELFTRAISEGKLTQQEIEIISDNSKYATKFKSLETDITKRMLPLIEEHPIWTEYLSKIRGIGHLTAARLICYIGDASQFDTISKLWAYSGLKVEEGIAQKRRIGTKLSWNPKMKVLCYLIADVFIKHRTAYRSLYDQEKQRLRILHPEKMVYETAWDGIHKTRWNDGHIHAMASRKMMKIFLSNYWLAVRTLYGHPIRLPYAIESLGHTTFRSPEEFFDKEKS